MSGNDDLQGTLVSCIAKTLNRPEDGIDITQGLQGIGLDSLSFLRLQMILEEKLGVQFDTDCEFDENLTGEDFLDRLKSRLQAVA